MDDNADSSTNLDESQGATNQATGETKPKKLSPREKLGRLSNFRLRTDAINFTSSEPHGYGGKAEVVKATLKRGDGIEEHEVAVKKLRSHDGVNERKFGNLFVHEVDVMAQLSHRNIVRLVGFVEELEEGKAWIVLSWEPNGNIQDTFAGIEYLHTRQPPICHGDLKSLNILVSASYRAIITDFGSARIIRETEDRQEDRSKIPDVTGTSATVTAPDERILSTQINIIVSGSQLTLTGPAWSLRWAAPEVAMGEPQSLASDIWAAGWICWEVMTNKVPFPELNSEGAITMKVAQGEVPVAREDAQLSQIIRLCSLMKDCWAFDPRNRPNITQCRAEVKWMPAVPPLRRKHLDSTAPSTQLLYQMAKVQQSRGNVKQAIQLFQQVASLAESAGDQNTRAKALAQMGSSHRTISELSKAEQHLVQAQEICARIGDDLGRANALSSLAQVYRDQDKLTQAEESYTRARDICSRIGSNGGLAETLHGLGTIFHKRDQYSQAEDFYNQALSIYARLGYEIARANTLRRLGTLSSDGSEYIKAEELFHQALHIYSRIGNDLGRANVKRDLGILYREQGLNTKAAPLFEEARSLYVQIGDSRMEESCSRRLAEVLKEADSSKTSHSVPRDDVIPSPAAHQQ